MDNLFRAFGERRKLSYVELNLETWRQLWRVLEMSDIVLLIVDIRCPVSLTSRPLFGMILAEGITYHVADGAIHNFSTLCFKKTGTLFVFAIILCVVDRS